MNLADIKKLVDSEGKIVIVTESGEIALVAMNFDEYKKIKSHKCQEEIPFDPETIVGPIMEEFDEEAPQQSPLIEPAMPLPIPQPADSPVIAREKELTVEDLPF